jgi:Protein of unknown function (DUF4012)
MSRRFRRFRRRVRQVRRRVRYGRHTPLVKKVLKYSLGGLAGLSLLWLLVTGLLAKQALNKLENRLAQVRTLVAAGDVDQARQVAADIPVLSARAHRLTTGPVWWSVAEVPYFGRPLDVTRGTVEAANQVGSSAVPQLMDVAALINPKTLRADGHTIRIAPLHRALGPLEKAASEMDAAAAHARKLPGNTWLSLIDSQRVRFTSEILQIRGYVDAAARAARVLPVLLGENKPQRYFIGLQNEAEMRGTGGLPGAFAIATTNHGRITFDRFESDAALLPPGRDHLIPTGLKFGQKYDSLYGPSLPTTTFVDSNVSPHFPYTARIWKAMWEKIYHQHIDHVIAVDPTVLAYFLAATGPAPLSAGGALTATNVVPLTEKDQYALFADNVERKNFEVSVLRAAARKLTSGAGTPGGLLQAASRSAGEQRLLVWSSDAAVESRLEETNYAGALPSKGTRPFSGFIVNNSASGKLDYYLQRSLSYARTGCGDDRDVIVTMTLLNNAPAAGLPPYVDTRLDHPPPDAQPGDSSVLLDYYATKGALLDSVTLNNQLTTASATTLNGLEVFRMSLELPRGKTQTIVLHLREPAGKGTPRIWKQPGVVPLALHAFNQPCT